MKQGGPNPKQRATRFLGRSSRGQSPGKVSKLRGQPPKGRRGLKGGEGRGGERGKVWRQGL